MGSPSFCPLQQSQGHRDVRRTAALFGIREGFRGQCAVVDGENQIYKDPHMSSMVKTHTFIPHGF